MPFRPSRRAVLTASLTSAAAALAGGSPTALANEASSASAASANLSFPSTRLARDAMRLINRSQQKYLRNHSLRGFLFGRATAEQEGLQPGRDYDDEVLFLICALHDMGLTALAGSSQRFEVAGADYAAEFLEKRGMTDSRIDTIWDGIALHTSYTYSLSPVFQRRRAPEIHIAISGIGIDVVGRPEDLPPGYADRVLARYPRLGGSRALTDAIVSHAMSDPNNAPPMTPPGEVLHQRHPSLPYVTWDMIINSNGWDD